MYSANWRSLSIRNILVCTDRDDGLAVVNLTGVEVDLNVTIEANITETDFLDLYLNLKDCTYRPYRKDNNPIL